MLFFGSTEEARNYSCKISVKSKFGNEFNYTGPVHTIDKPEKAIINSGFLLMIESRAAKQMLDKENNLKIEVTIQNRKSEAISTESKDFYEPEPESDYSVEREDSFSDSDY